LSVVLAFVAIAGAHRHSHRARPAASLVGGLREISYYPARNPWGGMWSVWQPSVIEADMAKIVSVGANTVRVFLQPDSFGYPVPRPDDISELGQFLSIAGTHGLRVHLTLFDLWSSYSDVTGSQQWAGRLLARFRGDHRIVAVELQNELDPTNPGAVAWARAMLPMVRAASGLPVTVSVTSWNTPTPLAQLIAALGASQPDFYDLHFYGTPPYMLPTFRAAKQLAGGRPLLIGETGYSTDPGNTTWLGAIRPVALQEQAQAYYYAHVEQAASKAGLPPVGLWNLNDFVALPRLSEVERHFGIYRLDGSAKPAASVIRAWFAAR
jgi:hypothetical protein